MSKNDRQREANLTEKLAACLLMLKRASGEPLLPITRDQAKLMTAKEIVSLVDFDHNILKRINSGEGSNHPTNLTPLLRADHREKTSKIDQKVAAKVRRFEKKNAEPKVVKTGYEDVFGNEITRTNERPKAQWPKGQKIAKHSDPWGKKFRNKAD